MHFLNSLLAIAGIGCFFIPAVAQATEEQISALRASDLFELAPDGVDAGCFGRDLDTMVQEAARLASIAIQALEPFTQDKSHSASGETRRLGFLAADMFGIQPEFPFQYFGSKFTFGADARSILTWARGNYTMVLNRLLSGSREDGGKLMCGDLDLQFVQTYRDVGYNGKGADMEVSKRFWYSAYWSERNAKGVLQVGEGKGTITVAPRKIRTEDNPNADERMKHCANGVYASTFRKSHLVILCDRVWDDPTLEALYAEQESWPKGKEINSFMNVGAVFLHEMMHYISPQIVDQIVEGDIVAYGYRNALVISNRKLSLYNADNYRVFALAAYLDKVTWDTRGSKQ